MRRGIPFPRTLADFRVPKSIWMPTGRPVVGRQRRFIVVLSAGLFLIVSSRTQQGHSALLVLADAKSNISPLVSIGVYFLVKYE